MDIGGGDSRSAALADVVHHQSLQQVDSASADSGFQDVDSCQSSDEATPTSVPCGVLLDIETLPSGAESATRVPPPEDDGSLLGMLFRRSTMRRSMRPFVPTISTGTSSPRSPSPYGDMPELATRSSGESSSSPSSSVQENSNFPGLVGDNKSTSSLRRSLRLNVQFAVDSATTSISPSNSSESTTVSIAENETLVTPTATPLVTSSSAPAPPPFAAVGDSQLSNSESNRHQGPGNDRRPDVRPETSEEREERAGGFWPHSQSSLLASLTCTIGMFDICRFSYLSFQYGGGFIIQFLMLTVIFGLPMLSFQMAVGQYMGSGIMDMWKASPIFQGVGIAAVFGMSLIGIYNVVPIAWMFIYFRDSFVATVTFKWGECRNFLRADECQRSGLNSTEIFKKAVPAYFQNKILQRHVPGSSGSNPGPSSDLVFENVFNQAVIWIIVFICLSKGVRSYGKVVIACGIFPLVCFYLVSIEILRRGSTGAEQILSRHTNMSEFFLNGWSWLAAAREVFFIWGINGAVLMQIASHNKLLHSIKRDCVVIILITLSVMMLSAFLTCACIYVIYKSQRGSQLFIPSSYESPEYSEFFVSTGQAKQMGYDIGHYMSVNYLLGVGSTTLKMDAAKASGYQAARLATEIYPMAVVSLGPHRVSAFWPVLFYLCLISFGIAQQLAIWRCVIEGFIAIRPKHLRPWETGITFVACIFGFVLGLPFTSEAGAFVVHFMDVCVGCAWWFMVIYLAQIFALILLRGRPFSSEDILTVFADTPWMRKWLAPLVGFSWNISLPITLLCLAITSFKLGGFGRMFSWDETLGYIYWPLWVRQLGALIQAFPICVIPVVSFIQAARYLTVWEQDFHVRLENLIRPSLPYVPCGYDRYVPGSLSDPSAPRQADVPAVQDDPPPKYTPPPSYNTAMGLKILKRLNSIRRSFRRSQRGRAIVAESPTTEAEGACVRSVELQTHNEDSSASAATTTQVDVGDVPPSYSAVVAPGVAAAAGAGTEIVPSSGNIN